MTITSNLPLLLFVKRIVSLIDVGCVGLQLRVIQQHVSGSTSKQSPGKCMTKPGGSDLPKVICHRKYVYLIDIQGNFGNLDEFLYNEQLTGQTSFCHYLHYDLFSSLLNVDKKFHKNWSSHIRGVWLQTFIYQKNNSTQFSNTIM